MGIYLNEQLNKIKNPGEKENDPIFFGLLYLKQACSKNYLWTKNWETYFPNIYPYRWRTNQNVFRIQRFKKKYPYLVNIFCAKVNNSI